jgi:hypothetical protein
MKTSFTIFNEETKRSLRRRGMGLPHHAAASNFRVDNHDFVRIRASWREAREALEFEHLLLKRLEKAQDLDAELNAISDENYEDHCPPLRGLDIGVAGVVLTLAALGCVTVTSCNGGCFGDGHHETYPLVVFYAKPENADMLLNAAEESGVGIGHREGGLMVWANNIWSMHNFAGAIMKVRQA